MHDGEAPTGPNWGHRFTVGLVAVIAAILGYLIAAAVIPRWWAQRVANVVDGSLTVGALYGLFIGFVFTVAPLLLLLVVWKWRSPDRTWLGWLGWLVLIVLIAAPNLMTLGIVLGISDAAHAGDRTLDVEGPGFRLWTLFGVVLGIVAVLGLAYLVRSRRTSRERADSLRDELRTREPDLNRVHGSYSGISMGTWLTERRLTQVAARLRSLRAELEMIDEQLVQFADDADELSLRALVSETAQASHESNEARKHLDAMRRHRAHVTAQITELEQRQDDLLERWSGDLNRR